MENNINNTNQTTSTALLEQAAREDRGWYRFGMIASVIVAVAAAVLLSIYVHIAVGIAVGYLLLALGTHLGHDCIAFDCFEGAWSKSIELPGVIFSLDLNGIIFMLVYRFIVAPIVSLFITVGFGVFGTIAAMLIAALTFPFNIAKFIKECI